VLQTHFGIYSQEENLFFPYAGHIYSRVFEPMRDIRLSLLCKLDLSFSAVLRRVEWWLLTNVSAQPIGPIFKGQAVHEDFILRLLGP
jgi:hypothetical protein